MVELRFARVLKAKGITLVRVLGVKTPIRNQILSPKRKCVPERSTQRTLHLSHEFPSKLKQFHSTEVDVLQPSGRSIQVFGDAPTVPSLRPHTLTTAEKETCRSDTVACLHWRCHTFERRQPTRSLVWSENRPAAHCKPFPPPPPPPPPRPCKSTNFSPTGW